VSTYRPIVITPYDPEIHTSISKTVFTGIKIATDDVDDFVLRGTPAPSKLVHWGSSDLSFSVSEITQDDGEVVHQIGLATGELYAMARDGLFINSNDFGESFFTDQMFVDLTAPTLGESSRLYEMTVDNTDIQQETIYLYSISGDELFDGNTPSAQEMIDFVADVETNGTYVLADLQRATPSEARLATTTVITDMPTNNYEWADEYYDYLWNPLDSDIVSNGSVNLTISASDLMIGETLGIVLPVDSFPDGERELASSLLLDGWIDITSGDMLIQVKFDDEKVSGTLRVIDYLASFPSADQITDFWELTYHPLQKLDLVTELLGIIPTSWQLYPYQDSSQLPAPLAYEDDSGWYEFFSFREMTAFDSSTGFATFRPLDQTYTGGAFKAGYASEPGNTTYVNVPSDPSEFWQSYVDYSNSPSSIYADFKVNKVLEDGWGYEDDFSNFTYSFISGSMFDDQIINLGIDDRFNGDRGGDWIHSFIGGGASIKPGIGADFVDATSIVSTSPNAKWWTNVQLTADDIWSSGYYALNASDANHVGTGDLISLDGYRQIQDVVFGSAEGYIRVEVENAYSFSNDDDKGIALFVDDMLTARHTESGQASETRLKDIAEIHTTVLDDIIDLTSSYHADQTGNVKVYGMDGDDILWGGSSNETLDGGNGADLINGGAGDDTLTGGSGADIFEFTATSGNDTITDYNQGEGDILRFFRRSADTNTPFIDEANDQVTWQADGHTVTINFDTEITASNLTIEYEVV